MLFARLNKKIGIRNNEAKASFHSGLRLFTFLWQELQEQQELPGLREQQEPVFLQAVQKSPRNLHPVCEERRKWWQRTARRAKRQESKWLFPPHRLSCAHP